MRVVAKLGVELMSARSNSFTIMLTKGWGKLYSDLSSESLQAWLKRGSVAT